jgi:hypothetical protein
VLGKDGQPMPGCQPIRVEVSHGGTAFSEWTGSYLALRGGLDIPIRPAVNHPAGVWAIGVRELSSGKSSAAKFQVQTKEVSTAMSDKTYRVRCLPDAKIDLNGLADDPAWSQAHVEQGFAFPWKQVAAPATEFRALCDKDSLYFTFRVHDEDIVVLDRLRDKQDVVFEDRAELFFSVDEQMQDYYCLEIDPRGRVYDYRGSYYRRFDPTWSWKGLETKASSLPQGYVVEGRMPLASFEALGFPRLQPGVKIRCGLYRAEFSHDRRGQPVPPRDSKHTGGRHLDGPAPIEDWMSWVDPGTQEPDFHVPASLGWLEVVE